ncbi:MAG: hypothetical protein A2X64_10425 [Ignavibacteria bacterium GWF2_33_9]|nr:MAG: hypothetical protein A2X64_10425 [Ignavibacteria bacterium GWF2_33_9]
MKIIQYKICRKNWLIKYRNGFMWIKNPKITNKSGEKWMLFPNKFLFLWKVINDFPNICQHYRVVQNL